MADIVAGRTFGADRRGTTALLFGLLLVPIVVAVGAGFDLTRDTTFRSALQAAADQAALAGASAYTAASAQASAVASATAYMTAAEAGLPANSGVSFAVATAPVTGAGGATTGYTVSVTATASVATTLMAIAIPAMANTVTATALNPVVTFNASLGSWKSSAWDSNTIYWYVVPADGSLPASSDLHELFSNASAPPASLPSITLTGGQTIGFALQNITGGLRGYGPNQYGSPQGHTNWLYSQESPPSLSAYPTEPKNCALQVIAATTADPNPAETPGSCSAATPALGTVNCAQAMGQTIYFFWNDMGGSTDDYDYNDAQYSLTCGAPQSATTASSSAVPTGVVLIR